GTFMSTGETAPGAARPAIDPDLIYVNGINPETGKYAVPPVSLDDLAKRVRSQPGGAEVRALHGDTPRAFAPPLGKEMSKLEDVGWAVVFPQDTPPEVRAALAPLLDHRRKQAGDLFKVLDYKIGELLRGSDT